MIAAHTCPRCQGSLTLTEDIGETYRSCVQCGYVSYGGVQSAPRQHVAEPWRPREAADRSAVRRRQIARARRRARIEAGQAAVA